MFGIRHIIASNVVNSLRERGAPQEALMHVWDRLVDGLSKDSEQELANLHAMLQPDDPNYVFIKDGRITSPKEAGAVAYRKV